MRLNIGELLSGAGADTLSAAGGLSLAEVRLGELAPFPAPLSVRAEFSRRAGIVTLEATVTGVEHCQCARCLTEWEEPYETVFSYTVVPKRENDGTDDDELIEAPGGMLELDALLLDDVVLSISPYRLCRPDCKGLCPSCGADLNKGECGCAKPAGDPRWAALKGLI